MRLFLVNMYQLVTSPEKFSIVSSKHLFISNKKIINVYRPPGNIKGTSDSTEQQQQGRCSISQR